MLTAERIRRDYRQAGAVHALLAPSAFIADDVFLAKTGHVGMVWRLHGLDSEGLDHAQRAAVTGRFRAALALLDERFRLYSYLVKSPAARLQAGHAAHPVAAGAMAARAAALEARAGDLFDVELYLVVLFEEVTAVAISARLRRRFQLLLALTATVNALDQDLSRAVDALQYAATGLETQFSDIAPLTRLSKAEAFRFLRRLVNYSGPDIALKYDSHVDYFMADAPITVTRYLEVGDARVAVLTMKEAPAQTFAGLLEDLSALPVSCIACLEWHRITNDVMNRAITARVKHFDGIRGKKDNASVEGRRKDHDDARLAMDAGRFYGECSLTLVLHHHDAARVARATAEARKLLAVREGCFLEETYNVLHAWAAIVPGNRAYNMRRLPLLETHAADLAFLFAPDHGQRDTAVAVLEARHGALYHYALHCEDVGHTLILGKTGSGKSYLINFLLLHLQQRDPQTVIFDLGHSYRTLAGRLGGSYVELGQQGGVTINPFALAASQETFHFLHALCRVLIDGEDGYRISAIDDNDLYDAIVKLYDESPDGPRRLRDLVLPWRLHERLEPWIHEGRFASTFDNVDDTLETAPFQVFEFEAMQRYPQLVEAVVFYILHRLTAKLQTRSRLTVCVMDEAWRFIKHPKLRDYVEEALKTWRKMSGSMLLATQAVEDFLASDLQRTVVESCHTKIFLANPNLNRETYAAVFGLNETELDLVTALLPKRQIMLKRASTTKVLNVNVDAVSAELFAAGRYDTQTH